MLTPENTLRSAQGFLNSVKNVIERSQGCVELYMWEARLPVAIKQRTQAEWAVNAQCTSH